MRDVDVSDLTDDEHIAIDAVLTTIIQDAIRIRARLNKPAGQSASTARPGFDRPGPCDAGEAPERGS
jgi:hypothetical protein